MVRIPNRDGEEEGRRMNPDSSDGIYVTALVEARCRLISQNRKMKEEENIKSTKVNALKKSAHITFRCIQHTRVNRENMSKRGWSRQSCTSDQQETGRKLGT